MDEWKDGFHVLMERVGWLRIDKFWFIVSTFPPFCLYFHFSQYVSTLFFPVFHPSVPTKPSTHSFIHRPIHSFIHSFINRFVNRTP